MQHRLVSSLALASYIAVINLLVPLAALPLLPFLLFIRKRRKTIFRRLGFESYPRGDQARIKPLWIHALSVGELLSCVPLIKELRIRLPTRPLYLSVSTLAAREIATEKVAADIDGLFYFPYDLLLPVERCLRQLRPAVLLLIETDIWPGLLATMRRVNIPCFLLNGRLSPGSFRFSRLLSALFVPAFETFAGIYPQSPEEAGRFLALGLETQKIWRIGNLKFDLAGLPPSVEMLAELRQSLGLRESDRVLLAGSTHPGEEAMLRSAFLALREHHPMLKLIIVPRHPSRAADIERLFNNDALRVMRLSEGLQSESDVIVVDRIGLLGKLYAVADVAFVGGSLVSKGGQNPIEPAAAGKPVLFGPDMSDFPEVSRLLLEAGGAIQVRSAGGLINHCTRLIGDRELMAAVGMRARAVVDEHRGISRQIAADIIAFLEAIETGQNPYARSSISISGDLCAATETRSYRVPYVHSCFN